MDIDFEHCMSHDPQPTREQCIELYVMSKTALQKTFNQFLHELGVDKGENLSTTLRYRDGYLRPSKNYETGPAQEFKNFVPQL